MRRKLFSLSLAWLRRLRYSCEKLISNELGERVSLDDEQILSRARESLISSRLSVRFNNELGSQIKINYIALTSISSQFNSFVCLGNQLE
jgi:hypothetical protein